MKKMFSRISVLLAALLISASFNVQAQETLHVYNWSDYITPETLKDFEAKTGIKVTYDVYDSNEILEAKMLAGHSGYDLVFPTARPFGERGIKAKIYQKIDKTKLSNYGNLDPVIMKSLSDVDPGNHYMVPYMWGTTGIGINVKKVKAILGKDFPLNSWNLLFDPKIVAKLKGCGATLMDDPTEVFAAAHAYKDEDPNDFDKSSIAKAVKTIKAVRPDIRYFHSSQYINDLANGDICVAQGYSGDILQAQSRAEEAKNGVEIAYIVPKEGAVVWTDTMMIPKDAPNPSAALKFINYLLEPKVIAHISDYVAYANANAKATPFVDKSITSDPGIYPPESVRKHFMVVKSPTDKQVRHINRAWTKVKTGQ